MTVPAHTLFPSALWQAFISAGYLLGVTTLTFFASQRLFSENGTISRMTWPRLCTLLIFLDSYLFLFSTAVLVFGVGLQMNPTACAAGIYLCVLFYTTSKILIYAFLTEKVYIVWDTNRNRPRLRSPVFLVCSITVGFYLAVIVILVIGRIETFRPGDGACVLGLKPTASIPLLTYDLYINVLLTTLFLYPLFRSKLSSARLRRVAVRTLFASAIALTTSTVNIAVLTLMHGRQLGWVCLASCGTDVVLNAAALFWVTAGGAGYRDGLSGGRNNNSTLSGGGGGATQSVAGAYGLSSPTAGTRSGTFKDVLNGASPARGTFSRGEKNASYPMGILSPASAQQFQIHVTTESEVVRSPPGESVFTKAVDEKTATQSSDEE
ncbi:hypothetical protein HMN09_00212900 [Mycena chlorophos]|uniref:Uncharacterized protein n=1 Tax=Mycena chlorophos TaxID=658473 RepID=A0A8H6TLS3_MYCCL|nr:hypothetical protein HMN09_00212900 [Mycena chlorophos]